MAQEGARGEEGGGEVGVDGRAPAIEPEPGDGHVLGGPDAGVGHARVEPAERLDGGRDERVGLRLVAQVGLQRDAAELRGERLGGLAVAVVVEGDEGALGGQLARDGRADPARGARDERGRAGESEIHVRVLAGAASRTSGRRLLWRLDRGRIVASEDVVLPLVAEHARALDAGPHRLESWAAKARPRRIAMAVKKVQSRIAIVPARGPYVAPKFSETSTNSHNTAVNAHHNTTLRAAPTASQLASGCERRGACSNSKAMANTASTMPSG